MIRTEEEIQVFTTPNGKEYVALDIIIMEFDFNNARMIGSWYFDVEPEDIQVDEAWVTQDDELYLKIPDRPAQIIWVAYVKEES